MKGYDSKQSKRGKTAYRTPSPFIAKKATFKKALFRKPGGK